MQRLTVFHRAALTGALLSAAAMTLASSPLAAEQIGMAVSVVTANSSCFDDILQVSGTVVARDEVIVRPEVEGLQVSKVLAEDGATVSAGQPLVQLVRPEWLPGTPATATMTASISGTVIHGPLPIGMWASARGEPMFRILRDGELDLQVEVAQGELSKIKPGQTVRVATLGGNEVAGTVRLVDSDVDPATQLGHARIQIRANGVKPGTFARASVDAGRVCATSVPLSALLFGPLGAVVQVVRNGHVETRRVEVGLFSGRDVQVRDGLAQGEIVVARAGAFLREGDPIRPIATDDKGRPAP